MCYETLKNATKCHSEMKVNINLKEKKIKKLKQEIQMKYQVHTENFDPTLLKQWNSTFNNKQIKLKKNSYDKN